MASSNGFVVSDSIKKSWKVFKKEWITVYAVQLLPIVVAIVYNALLGKSQEQSAYSIVLFFVYMIFQIIVSMGILKAYMELIRGKKVTMETFKSMMPKVVHYVIAQILMMLIVVGGFILLIVPGIIFSLMFMFTPYLVIDKGLGPIEALKASAKMTNNIKWDLIGFVAALAVLAYSGIFALLVGLVVTIPLAALAYVALYDKLKERL